MYDILADAERVAAAYRGEPLEAQRAAIARPAAGRPTINRCPTCVDGILTITHPRRCRACVTDGL